MILKVLSVGQLETNCYIFGDDNTGKVVVIDPGDEGEKIYDIIVQNGYIVQYIIATHGHVDHISAIKYLKEKTGAQVVIHKDDSDALINSQKNLSALLGYHSIQVPADIEVVDGQILSVEKYSLQVIHTPGHTPGGICVLVDNLLFSGDTLFEKSIGRTDLPGGNHQQLIQSIKNKLFVLADHIKVYPGHGYQTTIGIEKEFNPFL
ncbi:MAG: hydroxyacylglutathione hydrolase [Clostridiales bacterium]|nr:hydroxyacylglutathione hydrolase [Clostridiales bacterium]MDK2932232.1 hydroxyacylglutathione hydrolase [Clostridiales bacterium]